MNNEFLKKAAAVMTAATMLSTTAFAAVTIKDNGVTYDSSTKKLTVQYDGVDASKQASLLVYNVTSLLSALANDVPNYGDQATTPIVAIDQTAATGSFEATLPDGLKSGDKLAVKVGATGETTPGSELYTIPVDKAIAYGDVNNDGTIDGTDVTYVLSKFKGALSDDDQLFNETISVDEFNKRADVNNDGNIDGTDVTYVLSKFKGQLDKFPAEENGGGTPSVAPSEGASETPSDTPTQSAEPAAVISKVDTTALTAGTSYAKDEAIADGVTASGVAEGGSVSVADDASKGKVLALSDPGAGQSGISFALSGAEEPAKKGIIQYSASYKLEAEGGNLKDNIILRISNKNYVNEATGAAKGQIGEISTRQSGENYQLVYKDYFESNGKDGETKPKDHQFSTQLKAGEWYDITAEFDTTANTVKVVVKDAENHVVISELINVTPAASSAAVAADGAADTFGITDAVIITKGTNASDVASSITMSVGNPVFETVNTAMTLPDIYVPSDLPWENGESQEVVSASTFFNFSEAGTAFDINNVPANRADFEETVSFGGLTVYMDSSRDLEWQDGDPSGGNAGKLEYSTRGKAISDTNGISYTTSFNFGIGGTYSSLFEGMMLKTADGSSNVYLNKAEDGRPYREIRIRDLQGYLDTGVTTGYDKDGNEVDLKALTGQEEKLTDPFEKVIGIKVSGPCDINVISPDNKSRLVTISTADGTVLNPGDFSNSPLVQQGGLPVDDSHTGLPCRIAQYTGTEPTEIFISCPAGGVYIYGIEVTMVEE